MVYASLSYFYHVCSPSFLYDLACQISGRSYACIMYYLQFFSFFTWSYDSKENVYTHQKKKKIIYSTCNSFKYFLIFMLSYLSTKICLLQVEVAHVTKIVESLITKFLSVSTRYRKGISNDTTSISVLKVVCLFAAFQDL